MAILDAIPWRKYFVAGWRDCQIYSDQRRVREMNNRII
jgi:hypothetical protein